LKNLDGKVTEVGSSIHEVFIVMKMLETQVGQLAGRPVGNKEECPRLLKLIWERWRITLRRP
jgi:hypothetical protein